MIDLPQPLDITDDQVSIRMEDAANLGAMMFSLLAHGWHVGLTVLDDDPFTFGIVIASNDPFTDVRHPPQEDE